jgi:hypothetical protein
VIVQAVTDEFFREFRSHLMNKVDVIKPCSIIAAVGDGMSNTKGAAGAFHSCNQYIRFRLKSHPNPKHTQASSSRPWETRA